MSHPAQHPPEPARVHACVLVVCDYLRVVRDAESAECGDERGGVGKWVSSVRAVRRASQILVDVGEDGARNVGGLVRATTSGDVGEIEAAVDEDEACIVKT